jgi:hypothetical protein
MERERERGMQRQHMEDEEGRRGRRRRESREKMKKREDLPFTH